MNAVRRCIKDPFPGLSHWAGAVLSLAGLVALLHLARGRPSYVAAFAIYGTTLLVLYSASGLAHSIRCSEQASEWLTRIDCMAIFLLIAGTYTPLCVVSLRGVWGWSMLSVEWLMAAAGIIAVARTRQNSVWPRTVLYLVMAWIVAMAAIGPIVHALPRAAVIGLLAGGLFYSVGAVIFATDKPNLWPGRFVAHDLWHVLVLAGSACHFLVVLNFIARA